MAEKTNLSALLKRYRLEAGLSQEALATRANLSTRAVSDLERGLHRAPHPDTLDLLAKALSLSSHQRALLLAAARPELASAGAALPATPSPGLPLPPTALIGREPDLLRALALLRGDQGRLLTVTGPSGVGKTRLALQIALDLEPEFPDGVDFVDLTPVRDAALVPGLVAQALDLQEQADASPAAQVRAFLRNRDTLLLLDNFEQVLDSASFVADLLAWCPRLRVLVTSRTPLHVRGEHELPLASLAWPDAVTLFRERAQAVRPGQEYAEPEVAIICERLDCLPLAIELAAVQVKLLALPELAERLTNRLALLRGGARDLPARQQTMRDAIAWSYELLPAAQQRCFRGLAVFAGGGTLEAAQEVCWAAGEITPEEAVLTLAGLVDASLVQMEQPSAGRARFRLLELIGEFALERLRAAGEDEPGRARHAAYYAGLADHIVPFGPAQRAEAAGVMADFANARVALEWAEARGEAALGLRLVVGFGRFWASHGQISEAARWFERMLALASQTAPALLAPALGLRNEAFDEYCYLLLTLGKPERAESVATAGLQQAKYRGDHEGMSVAYGILGSVARACGQLDKAAACYAQSDAQAQMAGSTKQWLRRNALLHWGEVARQKGDFARATALFEQLLALARADGVTWMSASVTTLLGHLACQQHDYGLAQARYRESLSLYRGFGSSTATAWCLEGYTAALCAEGHHAPAARLCAAAVRLRAEAGTPLPPAEREAYEQTVASAKAALPEAAFQEEWRAGAALTHDEAIDYALAQPVPAST